MLMIYFPNVYDIKYLAKSCKSLRAGLQEIADDLGVNFNYILTLAMKFNLIFVYYVGTKNRPTASSW